MHYDFDQIIDRRSSDSVKWTYKPDVLPLWVADMDFVSPQPVIEALQARVSHGVFGYALPGNGLSFAITGWLDDRFGWKVDPQWLVYVPGVVSGFNWVAQSLLKTGQALAYQVPVYMPFLKVAENAGVIERTSPLVREESGRYGIDWDAFETSLDAPTRMLLLCSPHNPVGRVWERVELERMAEACLRNGVVICSDEIHADLVFDPHRHIPIASLSPEVANQTITLMAPSKTFNIPGLDFSFAVVPNPQLRKQLEEGRRGVVGHPNLLGMAAAEAAYRGGLEWLEQVLVYLQANRDFMADWLAREMPELKVTLPEGTYLAWVDCRALSPCFKGKSAADFFLEQGKVFFNDGAAFGPGGEGFIRVNFACPRSTLETGLERLREAIRCA